MFQCRSNSVQFFFVALDIGAIGQLKPGHINKRQIDDVDNNNIV
jgi:hypothetical protein